MYFLSLALFLGFIIFSYLVSQELFTQFDFDTTVRIQNKISQGFIEPFSILSLLGTVEITGLIWLGIFVLASIARNWKLFLALLLFPATFLFEIFGKVFLLHPSPPFMFFKTELPFYFPSAYVHTDYSYPSGHAIRTSFLIVLALFFIATRTKGIAQLLLPGGLFIFLGAMFLSRIYLGEHWTTDVVGGGVLGISFGILAGLTTLPTQKSQPSRQQQGRQAKLADS